jgi:hypothetical protein
LVRLALRRVLKRHVGERGAVSHADLSEDVMQVDLGRASRHLQPARDLLVGHPSEANAIIFHSRGAMAAAKVSACFVRPAASLAAFSASEGK